MPVIDHTYLKQPNYFYCGPTATAIALNARGQIYSLDQMAAELHTTENGTDSVNDVTRTLNGHLGTVYESVFIGGDDATPTEANKLWLDVIHAVTEGFAVVANVIGSIRTSDGWTYNYPTGHYVTVVGTDDVSSVYVADVDKREYWITVGQLATWIASRGYSAPNLLLTTAKLAEETSKTLYDDSQQTIFGVDLSDFDSDRGNNPSVVSNYKSDGISFVTHKTVEVTSNVTYRHTKLKGMLEAARDSGIPFLGGYVVPRSGVSAERIADEHISFLDTWIPWWRTFPGFFHQVDLELWDYDAVSAEIGNEVLQQLLLKTGQPVILYASKGQYGSSALSERRWNANYPSESSLPYRELYNSVGGNSGPGWTEYGTPSRVPEIWQYSSKAVVAGVGTTDVNAFRGSELAFAKMLGIKTEDSTLENEEEDLKPYAFTCQDGVSIVLVWLCPEHGLIRQNVGDARWVGNVPGIPHVIIGAEGNVGLIGRDISEVEATKCAGCPEK